MNSNILKLRELREIDKRILKNLIEDSRQPHSRIAENIGTSRQNISQRIKKLQERNLIKSYTINLNNRLFEEIGVKAYILFREDPNVRVRKEHDKKIVNIPQITDFSRLFGIYDGVIEILVQNNREVTNIINTLHQLKGIKETETFIVHDIIKEEKYAPIIDLLT
ncbi:MAG: Lrp/AsnC family transcriptional regulator [Candidatus Helarchaeota archaeon]|nr:Lrp/AsnC family transcriptional regulator [Candidatus Helarchaeota archaeon]